MDDEELEDSLRQAELDRLVERLAARMGYRLVESVKEVTGYEYDPAFDPYIVNADEYS